MSRYNSAIYLEDIRNVAKMSLPWEKLKNKTIMISGATGMIGGFLIDVLLHKNAFDDTNCKVYALGRSEDKFKQMFLENIYDSHLKFVRYNIQEPIMDVNIGTVDFVLHLASNTHPLLYSTDPIGTITTNILGVKNMLDYAVEHNSERFAFASSNEMYGENRGDVDLFDEDYCGYINCNSLRAGYPESKRCAETLCQAYKAQKGLDVIIPRLTRTYGPTMSLSDTKASSQFIKNGVAGKDIILKSAGTQYYSFTYVADAVSGLLTVLLCGESGEAYNVSDERGDVKLKDFASIVAGVCGTDVVFGIPDEVEVAGYSKATKARLDGSKLRKLGWESQYDIQSGIERTISILKTEGIGIK